MNSRLMTRSRLPLHVTWRWRFLATILAAGAIYCLMAATVAGSGLCEAFRLAAELIIFAVAAVMGYAAAGQFEHGVKTRLTWNLISVGAALFFVADVGLYLSSVTGPSAVANAGLLSAVGAITLSRVLLAGGLLVMVKVYRNSGLRLRLDKFDYVVMVAFGALNLLTIILGANTVRLLLSNTAADLTHWVLLICLPLPAGLILCSAFAVILWRYARQMGGGLVAKAWSGVLLYMVVLPARTVLLGLTPYILGQNSRLGWIIGVISFLGLAIAGWSLYLGASYQYEACTRDVPAEIEYAAQHIDEPEPNVSVQG